MKKNPFFLIFPTICILGILFFGGFIFGVLQSFGYLSILDDTPRGFAAYKTIFYSQPMRSGFILTLRVAFISTLLSSVLAIILAIMISKTKKFKKFFISAVQFNIPIPHVVAATSVLLTFSQSGIFSRLSYVLGITHSTSDFPIITNDPFGYGIIISYLWKEVPFICVIVLSALRGPVTQLDETAKTLGANYYFRLKKVILPYLFPSIFSASIIVFAFSFGSYEVPYLLGQTFPSTLPVVAYQFYVDRDLSYRPAAMAVSTIVAIIISIVAWGYMQITENARRNYRKL